MLLDIKWTTSPRSDIAEKPRYMKPHRKYTTSLFYLMVWNQQEIGAHTGDEEENLPLSPPLPPPPPRWRMFLAYKLVPDRSREYEYNLDY